MRIFVVALLLFIGFCNMVGGIMEQKSAGLAGAQFVFAGLHTIAAYLVMSGLV